MLRHLYLQKDIGKIMVGYQRWNKQFESTYNRIVNEQPLLPEDYDVTFQALKPFVFSPY